MRTLIVAALLAAGPAASATYENDTMVARRGGDSVRLWDAPCTHPGTLALIKPEFHELFRRARASVEGQDFFACWIVDGENVFVFFEDGDKSLIPLSEFKADRGV
jgi:hypothetical protein